VVNKDTLAALASILHPGEEHRCGTAV